MIVKEFARKAGVEPHVVRYYTRIGLLKPSRHPENDYQLFTLSDVDRMRFIRSAQALGFTLPQVAQLLQGAAQSGAGCCALFGEALMHNLELTTGEIERLSALKRRMERVLAWWAGEEDCDGDCGQCCPRVRRAIALAEDA